MNDEDLFLNYILLEDIEKINEYLSNDFFNATFENNYALRFSLIENKLEISKILMDNPKISAIVNENWIEQCIKEVQLKNKMKLLFNITNF